MPAKMTDTENHPARPNIDRETQKSIADGLYNREVADSATVAGWREILIAASALAIWFVLFTGGTMIGTEPYRNDIANRAPIPTRIVAWTTILLFWTMSNVGLLSMLAAVLGVFGQRARFAKKMSDLHIVHNTSINSIPTSIAHIYVHYASAIMRGFGVYALTISGLLVMATDSLIDPSQGQYVRLAGLISVISFYAGYDPEVLAGLLDRIKSFLNNNPVAQK